MCKNSWGHIHEYIILPYKAKWVEVSQVEVVSFKLKSVDLFKSDI